jgi:hypothetical protein
MGHLSASEQSGPDEVDTTAPKDTPIRKVRYESAEIDAEYPSHGRVGENDKHRSASYDLLGAPKSIKATSFAKLPVSGGARCCLDGFLKFLWMHFI